MVAPESRRAVREQFARKLTGAKRSTSYVAVLLDRDGKRRLAELDSVRLEDGNRAFGVFGLVDVESIDELTASTAALTPRQREVLVLLASGCSTEQIGHQLSIARETVRNHVRGVLHALGAHSRLEAVARARAQGDHLIYERQPHASTSLDYSCRGGASEHRHRRRDSSC